MSREPEDWLRLEIKKEADYAELSVVVVRTDESDVEKTSEHDWLRLKMRTSLLVGMIGGPVVFFFWRFLF